MHYKKWICTLLVLVLLLSLIPGTATAISQGHGTITGRQEAQMSMQLAALDSRVAGPSLAPGNHELWIDRIDQLPSYARNLYIWLENNSKNNGALINHTRAGCVKGESGQYDTYLYRFHTITGNADFTFTGSDHKAAAQEAMFADLGDTATVAFQYAMAAYGAFDRDHPEVFWLNGRNVYGYDISFDYDYGVNTGTVSYTVNLYFYVKNPDFDVRNEHYQNSVAIDAAIAVQDAAIEEILSNCPDGTDYDKVRYLNDVLTRINAYNSEAFAGRSENASLDAWKSISALTGRTGADGPVCEGYARALKILCNKLGIGCVLAEGQARSSLNEPSGAHMWNYIELDGAWYACDITWNDPVPPGREEEAYSGYESESWLLLGHNTVRLGMPFSTSHQLTNHTTLDSLQYTNGPIPALEAYSPPPEVPEEPDVPVVPDVPVEPEIVTPTLTLKAPTLEFKDMITIITFYTAENTQDVVEMGMITYSYKADVADIATAEHVIPGADYDAGSGRYYSASQGIHAKYLGDTVYLSIYAKLSDGSYTYTKVVPYSPITYATNQLNNSTNAKLKQLVAAMLNYGAAAQVYFGHNTDNLANAGMTEEQLALPEEYRADMIQAVPTADQAKQGIFYNNKGFSKRSPAVSFEGAFSINYFFTPAYMPVGEITFYYWNEADFAAADVLTPENASGSFAMSGEGMGQYRADIEGIAAKDLSKAVYVAAVYTDGTNTWTSGVLGYSIGAYCSSQASKEDAMADLAMATAVYGYHAKAYFG